MDLKTLNLEALKALAYDQFVILEQAKHNLALINQEIAIKSQPKSTDQKPDEPK